MSDNQPILVVAGLALVISFFLDWGHDSSGYDLARDKIAAVLGVKTYLFWAVPALGAALVGAALLGVDSRILAVATGVVRSAWYSISRASPTSSSPPGASPSSSPGR